ncbi:MAG TPA: sugar nucleotide-binding protein, partial [Anaerolineales bacterium]
RQQSTMRMVTDQVSNPTWCRTLAEMTAQILARGDDYIHERAGLYHLAGDGLTSRFEWARLILELDPHRQEQTVRDIFPALTTDFPTPAQRPLFSAMECSRFGHVFDQVLPPWQKALRLALDDPLH